MNVDRPEGFNYLPEAWRAYIAALESVREEALEEAAKVCEKRAQALSEDSNNGYVEGDTNAFIWTNLEAGYVAEELDEVAAAIRALQSPARVAEGDELSRHLESEHHAIRAQEIDSPTNTCSLKETCQWVKQIALQRPSAPESPAKEQPGEQNGWIPVGERLPEHGVNVLFVTRTGIWLGWRNAEGHHQWLDHFDDTLICDHAKVTHWMPLPEAPK